VGPATCGAGALIPSAASWAWALEDRGAGPAAAAAPAAPAGAEAGAGAEAEGAGFGGSIVKTLPPFLDCNATSTWPALGWNEPAVALSEKGLAFAFIRLLIAECFLQTKLSAQMARQEESAVSARNYTERGTLSCLTIAV